MCRQLLDFYKTEASVKAPILIDFLLKKENNTKVKTAFETKDEFSRTQEDVNLINKSASEFNKALTRYNTVNKEIFDRRSVLMDSWNKNVQSFFDRNIPK